ncbi:MAG: PilZ domain-containing protein [Calditrichaceae bacterium]
MAESKDRRTFDRSLNTSITAFLIRSNWFTLLKFKSRGSAAIQKLGKDQLKDLSASGSCIISNIKFEIGDSIHLIIYAPRRKIVFIKGLVRWAFAAKAKNSYYVGIQFKAYGKGKKYNSYKNLNLLREYVHGNISG